MIIYKTNNQPIRFSTKTHKFYYLFVLDNESDHPYLILYKDVYYEVLSVTKNGSDVLALATEFSSDINEKNPAVEVQFEECYYYCPSCGLRDLPKDTEQCPRCKQKLLWRD